jgi:transcriptional regulator with XRE-family HTH domain
MDIRTQFGMILRDFRIAKNLTQEELAFRAGMHTTYLSRLESGRFNPSLAVIVDLSQALSIHPSELLLRLQVNVHTPPTQRRKSED